MDNKIVGKKALKMFEKELKKDNFILYHGTSVKNAESIMKTGLKMMRTTAVSIKPDVNPLTFASYAWKDIPVEESVNVIVEIPLKDIWGNILKGYNIKEWIEKLRNNNEEEFFIRTLLEKDENESEDQVSFFDTQSVLPNYFIKGYAKLKDRNSYLIDPNDVDVRKIEFIENPNYFENLGLVKQQQIINYYHDKYQKIMNKPSTK